MIKNLIRSFIYSFLLNHRTIIEFASIPSYEFSSDELRLVTLSTNNMIETPVGYFRFCRRWMRQKSYDGETSKMFDLLNRGGQYADNQMDKFFLQEKGRRSVMNPLFHYDTFCSNRSIASYKIACLLGQPELLTKCEFCWLKIDNSEPMLGTMSSLAKGTGFWGLSDDIDIKSRMTPSLLRDLSNLEILDTICYEPDHGANNYMNQLDAEGKIQHLCAFDNDNPKDFFFSSDCTHSLTTETKPMVHNGNFNRQYADKDTIERLLSLTKSTVTRELSPYLNCVQLHFCWKRINKLQQAVQNSLKAQQLALLNPDDWTQQMVEENVSGKNGRTYMYVLVDWKDYYINSKRR